MSLGNQRGAPQAGVVPHTGLVMLQQVVQVPLVHRTFHRYTPEALARSFDRLGTGPVAIPSTYTEAVAVRR